MHLKFKVKIDLIPSEKENKILFIFFNKTLLFVEFTKKKNLFVSYRFNEVGEAVVFVAADVDGEILSNGFDNCLLYNG